MNNNTKVQLNIGDIVLATITNVVKTHVEMSLGDVYAIMPASEYSWRRSYNIKSELKIEDKIKAIVIMIQDDVVVLSVKRLEDDPWKSINESFKIGDQVKGIVTRVLDYGAFVEIKPNLLGLLHKTNINTTTKDIRTIVSKGQEIGVNIISIDKENRKISFAMINV